MYHHTHFGLVLLCLVSEKVGVLGSTFRCFPVSFSVDKLPIVQHLRKGSLEECDFSMSLMSYDIVAEFFNLSELRCPHLYSGFVGNSIN